MPNSFTVFPNILPGNVTIGGNLTVSGDQVRIGVAAPFVRVGRLPLNNQALFSVNLGFDGVTRDTAANAQALELSTIDFGSTILQDNAAGTARFPALLLAILTDHVTHTHTGDVTQDTIYSKLIPAGTLGANGALKIRLHYTETVQGAGLTQYLIRLGAANIFSWTATSSTPKDFIFEGVVANVNAQNSQKNRGIKFDLTANAFVVAAQTSAIDTSVDQTFTVQVTNANATDSQDFTFIHVDQINSFGPV